MNGKKVFQVNDVIILLAQDVVDFRLDLQNVPSRKKDGKDLVSWITN